MSTEEPVQDQSLTQYLEQLITPEETPQTTQTPQAGEPQGVQPQTGEQVQSGGQAQQQQAGTTDLIEYMKQMDQKQNEFYQFMGFMMNQMQQTPQQMPQQQTQQTTQPKTEQTMELDIPDDPPEELQRELEDLWVENPSKAMAKIGRWQQEQFIKRQQEAEIRRTQENETRVQRLQSEYATAYADLIRAHGESTIEQLGPKIEEIMTKQRPNLLKLPAKEALSIAFDLARNPLAGADQAALKDRVKNMYRDEIIREYLTGVQRGSQAPATIAGQPGGMQSLSAPNEPRTLDDSMKLWLRNSGR